MFLRQSFQFYLSSIKSYTDCYLGDIFRSFNSTLVQLKGARLEEAGYNPYSFNSTLVQLKGPFHSLGSITPFRFNSTLVQLKGYTPRFIDLKTD